MDGAVAVRYEIEVNYRGFQARSIIVVANSNFEARAKAKVWAHAETSRRAIRDLRTRRVVGKKPRPERLNWAGRSARWIGGDVSRAGDRTRILLPWQLTLLGRTEAVHKKAPRGAGKASTAGQ